MPKKEFRESLPQHVYVVNGLDGVSRVEGEFEDF